MNNENVASAPQSAPASAPAPAAPAPTPNPQPATMGMGAVPMAPGTYPHHKKSKLPLIIGGSVAAAAVIGLGIFGLTRLGGGSSNEDSIFNANAFFIYDEASKAYALFNKNGKQLTEFNISEHGDFVNGYAKVVNLENENGIIGDNGKMSVKYGTYTYIGDYDGLYTTETDQAFRTQLITGKGKKIVEFSSDASDFLYGLPSSNGYLSIKLDDDKYNTYNVKGELIAAETEKPYYDTDNGKDGVTLIDFGNRIDVYETATLKKVFSAETDKEYGLKDSSDNHEMIVLDARDYDDDYYATYISGKFNENYDKCENVILHGGYYLSDKPYLVCRDESYDDYLITADGNVSDIDTNKYKIMDTNHYAAIDKKQAFFYVNGETNGAKFEKVTGIAAYYDNYIVTSSADSKIYVTDVEGNVIYAKEIPENESFYSYRVNGLDPNGNIIIRDGEIKEDADTYVVNKNGDRITDNYEYVYYYDELGVYEGQIDYDSAIISADGKNKTELIYRNADVPESAEVILAERREGEGAFDLLDKNLKVIATFEGDAMIRENSYISVTKDNTTTYYTLKGEKFFETTEKN